MWKLVFAIVCAGALAAAGCKSNPSYCAGAPDNNCSERDAGPPRCERSADCAAPAPICDVEAGTCIACTAEQPEQCTGTTPICGDDHTCQPCRAHTECASQACAPDGSCADAAQVAYIARSGTDNVTCTRAAPCTRFASGLATGRPFLKLHDTLDEAVAITDRDVVLLADPGARLRRPGSGVVLEIRGASQVTIDGLEITGGSNPGGIGISIPAGSSARLTLLRSRVTSNAGGGLIAASGTVIARRNVFFANAGGGVALTNGTEFDLENNVIARNGNIVDGTFGGVFIAQTSDGMRRLEFNTITMNGGPTNVITGVACSFILRPTTFSNNIIFGNQVAGTGAQVSRDACAFTYSAIGPDGVDGPGNVTHDPRYADPFMHDFHLGASSPLIDAADPAASIEIDLDGQARPQGARRDIGADEYAP